MKQPLSPKLGVYVHWPFCVSKCPYCDFNSHVSKHIDIESWRKAYLNELAYSKAQTPNHTVHSIFFGGGTPSLMPPHLMESIITAITQLWRCDEDLEITFEANPTSVESSNFKAFKEAGANRVSIGIQAFNNEDLQFLGRPHNLEEGIKAIETAQTHFNRMSFDLIYARPNQTLHTWESELQHALSYAPTHISLYQLTIEPGTAFKTAHSRGDFTLPDETLSAELYQLTESVLNQKGLFSYEVSNYATKDEACKHNLLYWEYEDYIGIGPGAHGRITVNQTKHATRRHRAPDIWLNAALTNTNAGEHECLALSNFDSLVERLLMGLRLTDGIYINTAQANTIYPAFQNKLHALITHNLLSINGSNKIKATPEGRLKLNSILGYLFT